MRVRSYAFGAAYVESADDFEAATNRIEGAASHLAKNIHQQVATRKEQQFLKGCQLQYFLFSITAVGLFVGFSHLQGDEWSDSKAIAPHAALNAIASEVANILLRLDQVKAPASYPKRSRRA